MNTLKITDLPSIQPHSEIGITMQPSGSSRTLAQRGQCFRERRSTILASQLRYLALYCPENVTYKHADRSDVVMDLGLRRRVYAIVEIGDSFRPTSELIPAYDDLFFYNCADAGQRASERWSHAVNIVRVYKLVPAISIDRVWDIKRPSWARDLFLRQKVEVAGFKDAELIDMGLRRMSPDRLPRTSQISRTCRNRPLATAARLRKREDRTSSTRWPARFAEANSRSALARAQMAVRRGALRRPGGSAGPPISSASSQPPGTQRSWNWVSTKVEGSSKHAGGEWFRINRHELETSVAQTQLPWIQRNR